jgi:outer membrane protein assembly factor BamD (BamD/ComL family)
MIKQAFELVGARQWHGAERLVMSMETEFPGDHDVAKARNYLNHARHLNEEETLAATVRDVESLMQSANWDHALSRATALVEGFPDNGRARELLQRVQRERDAYYESTVARMFDELRHDIDRRMWRRAFMHAQHLLERFPSHPRAEAVRRQLKTLQDNAEIEERQELEVRIQELIKSQRLDEAIALGEDLIRRYPMSPQAESLDTLLPRLRDLAEHGAEEEEYDPSYGSGAPIDDEIETAPRSA